MFEQPLNERMRTFLRLDFLYTQALYHNEKGTPWGSRAAVDSLLDILSILTRGDMRTDVLKEIERHLALLNEFQNRAGIDTARLRTLMSNLVRLRTDLAGVGGSWLAPLQGLRLPGGHQAPQRDSWRHLRIRPAGLFLLA